MQLEDRKPRGTADLLEPQPDRPAREERSPNDSTEPLLPENETRQLRDRWMDCQGRFVDEPRDSVRAADELVAEVMQKLARQFANTRQSLERQWSEGEDASTEDLRIALQRYRDFFNRLLTI